MSKQSVGKARAELHNKRAALSVGVLDLSVVGVIFACKQLLLSWLSATGQLILFPLTIATQGIEVLLAWHQVYLDRGTKSRSLIKALVETGVLLGITTAVIGVLFFTPFFVVATPFILTGVIGLRSLFHAAAAIFYLGKATAVPSKITVHGNDGDIEIANPKRTKYLNRAVENAASAVIGLTITATIVAVMALGYVHIAAFVGVPIIALSVGYSIFKLASTFFGGKAPVEQSAAERGLADTQHRNLNHHLHRQDAVHEPLLSDEDEVSNVPSILNHGLFANKYKDDSAQQLLADDLNKNTELGFKSGPI